MYRERRNRGDRGKAVQVTDIRNGRPSEIPRLREKLADDVWAGSFLVALLSLVTATFRDVQFGGVTWQTAFTASVCLATMIAAPFHRRMSADLRAILPIVLLFLGAGGAMVRTGLQGPGLCYLVFVNVLAAMMLKRWACLLTFAATCGVLAIVAGGYMTHRLQPHPEPAYSASFAAWAIAASTLAGMGWVVYRSLTTYHGSLLRLSRQVETQRDAMAEAANFDQLTGLPSRRLAWDRLATMCRQSARSNEPFAVLYLDLDGFKAINDRYGHQAGDDVLATVAGRLTSTLRRGDTAARWGGDEFLVLLVGPITRESVAIVAAKLTAAIEPPIDLGDTPLRVGASIGVALFPQDGITPQALLLNADTAMYATKDANRPVLANQAP
jgi:diguanylate cyclase (GGDEF)-like protein